MNRILLTTALVALAGPTLAADFYAPAPVTAATIYPDGALTTHTISVDLPAGEHRLFVPVIGEDGVPTVTGPAGVTVGTIGQQYDAPVDPENFFTPALIAARDAVEALEDQVTAQQDRVSGIASQLTALDIQQSFVSAIRPPKDGATPDDLAALAQHVHDQTATALAAIAVAQQGLRAETETLADLQQNLATARARLAQLNPPKAEMDLMTLDLVVDHAMTAQLTVEGTAYAAWAPVYDLRLAADGTLSLDRKAMIGLKSDTPWHDVMLTLSSVSPDGQLAPSDTGPNQASIYLPQPTPMVRSAAPQLEMMVEEEPMIIADSAPMIRAMTQVDGVAVTYAYPRPVSLTDGEEVLLTLDTLTIAATTEIHASPRHDDTAFLMTLFTNETGEPLLPGSAQVFRQGHFMGETEFPLVPAGAEATLPMGPIEGLRLNHAIARNETGDTGILSRSNTREQQISFSVENLTGEAQDLTAFYPLTYSEQEDLRIALSVTPKPDATDIDDKRGVSSWDMSLAPGATQTVEITIKMDWPEGQDLRWYP